MNSQFDYSAHAKLKQQWLILFSILAALGLGYTTMLWLFPKLGLAGLKLANSSGLYRNPTALFLIRLLLMLLFLFLEYDFVYKKNGTRWLMFILIIIPFSYFLDILYMHNLYPVEIGYKFVTIPIGIAYWYVSYKLYFMNKQLHKIKN